MEVLILGAVCLYSVSACIWVVWKGFNIRWLQICADHPFQVRYRYSLNSPEAWKTLDLRKRSTGRPADMWACGATTTVFWARPTQREEAGRPPNAYRVHSTNISHILPIARGYK